MKMTKLRDDPVKTVPKRVLVLSLCLSIVLAVVTVWLEWSTSQILIGFWAGVITNLISFRLMVIGARNLLEKSQNGLVGGALGGGFFGRLGLYVICLFLVAQISLYALLAAAVGLSMVGVVLKLGSFFLSE